MSAGKRKILIASFGTRGDVQPYAVLARALVDLGLEVVLATGEGFDAMIEAAGAWPRPLPIDYQSLLQDADMRAALFSLRGKFRAGRRNLALQRDISAKLFRVALEEQPDLILFNLKATVVTLAARRLGVPALPTALQPVTAPTGTFPLPVFGLPDMGTGMNRLSFRLGRALMGLGTRTLIKPLAEEVSEEAVIPGALMDGHMPDGTKPLSLQGYSRALVPTPADWPETAWCCGYWLGTADPAYRPPAELMRFLETGPPPVYLGFGSMPSVDPAELTTTVLEALRFGARRAVLATGWGGLAPDSLPEDLAARVFVLDKAPHSWLFPRCSAVVHHGGAGTTHEALRWGKPSLVCPVFGDQPFWGARVHAIGAGPAPIRQGALTPESLRRALDALDGPAFAAAAERAAAVMAEEPGAAGTAARLDALLRPASVEAATAPV